MALTRRTHSQVILDKARAQKLRNRRSFIKAHPRRNIQIILPLDLATHIRQLAAQEDRSVSYYLRRIIIEHFEYNESPIDESPEQQSIGA